MKSWVYGWLTKKLGRPGASWLAKQLHVSVPTIWRWAVGQMRPSTPYRMAIEVLSQGKVPASAWLTKNERAFVEQFKQLPPELQKKDKSNATVEA